MPYPKFEAGIELLCADNSLKHTFDSKSATQRQADFNIWCSRWTIFLNDHSIEDGRCAYICECFCRTRKSLVELKRYIYARGLTSTNVAIESVSAHLCDMLRYRRGMPVLYHLKAAFRWFHLRAENTFPAAEACE